MPSLLGLMIADGHAIATLATDDQSLQQAWPFSRRAMTAIPSEGLTILAQLLAIGFTGIARPRLSAIVFPVLYRLCESPRRSAEIYCCLPCLLST